MALVLALSARWAGGDEPARARPTWPGLTEAGSVLLPNGWSLKPAGRQQRLGDFPVAMSEHPSEPVLAVLHAGYGEHEVITLDVATGATIGRVALPETFQGLAWSADGKHLFVGGGFDDVIYRFDHASGLLSNRRTFRYPDKIGRRVPAGLAVSRDGGTLWVANAFGHTLARFDGDGNLQAELALGADSYPYGLAWDEPAGRLYVSLWNKAEVAVVDTRTAEVVGRWATQEHPNEMLLAKGGDLLYVANANRNTVSVFDARAGRPTEIIGTAIDPNAPPGSTPSSLALTPDENVLFVANANTNDVAAINVKEKGASAPLGFIPTGWYPTSVRVAKGGKSILVANGKGATSKPNREGPNPLAKAAGNTREYIAGLFQGTLSIIPMPGPREMGAFSKTVYECSPLRTLAQNPPAPRPAGHPIPNKVGEPSPITHCIYIVKENRTYDQIFGDMPAGNGEPALCLFPEEVTPNHHALAREFVLLDNFYVEAEVSADGHEWTMGAYATDYVEKTWPLMYRGDRRVPYPAEGALQIARPAGGYLWDAAAAKGVTYRSYGEFIENGKTPADPSTTKVAALQGHFDPGFRGYDLNYPDVRRADRFLEELAGFEKAGEMPRLIILRLPNDHTSGTRPGSPTVSAMVADNDLALGRIVEGLSKSRFWPKLAIFVVEDDAQNGSDHVDAHRTVALAISPYIKKGSVDSSMYSTSSMLRTMELILGLDPMSQFDAAARPMAASFTTEPDLAPYVHRPARIDLEARNTRDTVGAAESMKLDLDEAEDRADDLAFNEIIWKAVRGADSVMPPPVRSAFVLPRD
ncbi:bifunctional YncE family protein/alkaline phosphatase family protein [Tundrisphaera sp. TA3]|uniref:bifunctional YncE family protein/alkaline phosphatase family protein n=1 Tax=Tundrisphaera sp. TA3 TaxID=3435775 RepID=UPI003EC095B5